jgi:integrase
MARKAGSFRVGRVLAYQRGRVWYLCYHESGRRLRPRVGPDRDAARLLAAQTNAQLEAGAPAVLSFEPVAIDELRDRWLQHHELVLRSSVATIDRYRTATQHLLCFLAGAGRVPLASQFQARHAEEFTRYLRAVLVAPNGHPNTPRRPLMDKGVKYILETCCAMFTYALKRRHMSPYAENPFTTVAVDRLPVEEVRPVVLFSAAQERAFFEACDGWQLPLFLTLALTGLRPGELTHLLLPDDLDLDAAVVRVRNKPKLGWQVKTRAEREVPLVPVLVVVLRRHLDGRTRGPVFRRRRYDLGGMSVLGAATEASLERELLARVARREDETGSPRERAARLAVAATVWRDAGAVREDRVRLEFLRLTKAVGIAGATAPKLLRHQFATALQDANVDPLIRNQLMGHAPAAGRGGGLGMTAVYTHTRPETRRAQLEQALAGRPAVAVAGERLARTVSS